MRWLILPLVNLGKSPRTVAVRAGTERRGKAGQSGDCELGVYCNEFGKCHAPLLQTTLRCQNPVKGWAKIERSPQKVSRPFLISNHHHLLLVTDSLDTQAERPPSPEAR